MSSATHAVRKRVAAIDCGTNSIRLLIADLTLSAGGAYLVDVHREMRIVRLGEGVDATGRLSAAALDRTWAALSDYVAIIGASGVDAGAVRMTATSATRDASNRDAFASMVRSTLGQAPEVIAGTEEARLSFRGALGDMAPADGPFLVFDIGGGSTEFVVGTVDARGSVSITGAVSQNIGSVRITERLLRSDPPTAAEIDAAQRWSHAVVADGLNALGPDALGSVRRVVAVSGTATTVMAAALELPSYDPAKIHLATLTESRLAKVSQRLLAATRGERATLGYMHPGRVDVIGGGSLILATIARALSERLGITELTVSEHDILDGIALSLA